MTLMPSPQSNAMCLPCQCNLEGSLSSVCDDLTSQCPCKTGVMGLLCNMPQIGYYVKALDAIIYEAESAELSPVRESCMVGGGALTSASAPPSQGATCCSDPAYYTGTGYVTFASSGAMVQFMNVQVPKDDTYMLILRYQVCSAVVCPCMPVLSSLLWCLNHIKYSHLFIISFFSLIPSNSLPHFLSFYPCVINVWSPCAYPYSAVFLGDQH